MTKDNTCKLILYSFLFGFALPALVDLLLSVAVAVAVWIKP